MPPFFIFGTGRSGTTTLARILHSASNCICLNEGVTPGQTVILGSFTAQFPEAYARQDDIETLRRLFGKYRLEYVRDRSAAGYAVGEADPFAYPFISFLAQELPDARFVQLVRNGYNTVLAWEARKRTAYPRPGKAGVVPRLARAKPVPGPDDPWHDRWEGLTRREKITWFWVHVNGLIEGNLSALPEGRRAFVRLEDLNEGRLGELAAFLDVSADWDRTPLSPAVTDQDGARRDWTPEQLAQFEALAGDVMRRYGYDVVESSDPRALSTA